jgi:hypothetical protein
LGVSPESGAKFLVSQKWGARKPIGISLEKAQKHFWNFLPKMSNPEILQSVPGEVSCSFPV